MLRVSARGGGRVHRGQGRAPRAQVDGHGVLALARAAPSRSQQYNGSSEVSEMSTGNKPLRVIQWATGAIGKFNIVTCARNPAFELVGCWVFSPEKAGRDAGEIAGIGPIGVKTTGNIDEILAMDADIVQYAPLLANVGEICRLLESGKNVITPSG